MTNADIAKMKKTDFLAGYKKLKAAREGKKAINTDIPLERQLNKFIKTSFSDQEEKAMRSDALSV